MQNAPSVDKGALVHAECYEGGCFHSKMSLPKVTGATQKHNGHKEHRTH